MLDEQLPSLRQARRKHSMARSAGPQQCAAYLEDYKQMDWPRLAPRECLPLLEIHSPSLMEEHSLDLSTLST
jgi:hypothetical protein